LKEQKILTRMEPLCKLFLGGETHNLAQFKGWTKKILPSKRGLDFFGPKMALASAQGHWRGQKSLSPLWKAIFWFSLSTPSIGPRYGFPRLKIIISRNIYRIGPLIVKTNRETVAIQIFLPPFEFTKRPVWFRSSICHHIVTITTHHHDSSTTPFSSLWLKKRRQKKKFLHELSTLKVLLPMVLLFVSPALDTRQLGTGYISYHNTNIQIWKKG
jgi:hypothetical protein